MPAGHKDDRILQTVGDARYEVYRTVENGIREPIDDIVDRVSAIGCQTARRLGAGFLSVSNPMIATPPP